jgi:uncharacterized protein (DUF2345 family)
MNDIPRPHSFNFDALNKDKWSKLMALADMIEINRASDSIEIRNGKSRIVLRADGTVRIEGERIVQTAEKNIVLDAAYIDLN